MTLLVHVGVHVVPHHTVLFHGRSFEVIVISEHRLVL